jgi:hypothetical protein
MMDRIIDAVSFTLFTVSLAWLFTIAIIYYDLSSYI